MSRGRVPPGPRGAGARRGRGRRREERGDRGRVDRREGDARPADAADGRALSALRLLVVRRGRALRFVEVKEKRGERLGDPLEMVGPEKQRRIRRAAEAWLASRPDL